MSKKEFNTEKLANEYDNGPPEKIIKLALENFDNIAISFSGAEDVVLIDIAKKIQSDIKVFSLDTGRLHAETYRFIEQVREHYKIDIDVLSPDTEALQEFVLKKGLYSFYKDGHKECCGIRKVVQLRRKLNTIDAWITGQRKDKSPGTRDDVPVVEYIRSNNVPFNSLHEQGFISIGCEPCTRPVLPNQHEREGRWWWEDATQKECGLHAGNLKK